MSKLKGVVPNMLTPMSADGRVDEVAAAKLVDFLIDSGVGGIWALGSAGEDIHISQKDRIRLANATITAVENRVPLVVGLGTASYYDILDFVDAVHHTDGTCFHFLPYDLKIDDAGLIGYVLKLADKLPRPIWLYHNVKRGRPITIPVVQALHEHDNIVGMKVGGYNLTELTTLSMLNTDTFQVSGAGSGQMFQLLSLGLKVHMTSDANCYPEIFAEMFDLFTAKRFDEALRLQHRIIKLSHAIPRTGNGEYAAEEKYILAKRGILEEYVNPAYRTTTAEERQRIDEALKDFGFPWL